jgi:hypothetical protein
MEMVEVMIIHRGQVKLVWRKHQFRSIKGTQREVRQFIGNPKDIMLEFSKGNKIDVIMFGMFSIWFIFVKNT